MPQDKGSSVPGVTMEADAFSSLSKHSSGTRERWKWRSPVTLLRTPSLPAQPRSLIGYCETKYRGTGRRVSENRPGRHMATGRIGELVRKANLSYTASCKRNGSHSGLLVIWGTYVRDCCFQIAAIHLISPTPALFLFMLRLLNAEKNT